MLSEFFVLVAALFMANAASPQTDKCSVHTEVNDGGVFEKNLCYVKNKVTAFGANKLCTDFGMKMYQPQSSAGSRAALVSFGQSNLGGSRKAQVYVGNRVGSRCQAANGVGNVANFPCRWTLTFLCEYKESVTCQSYETFGNPSLEKYGVLSTSIVCKVGNAISNPTITVLSESVQYTKEQVTFVNLGNTGSTRYPVALVKSFPNLKALKGDFNQITEITRANLQGLTSLVAFDSGYNLITSMTSDVFSEVPNLKYLVLSGNPIKTVSGNIFSTTLAVLEEFSLSGGFGDSPCFYSFANTRSAVATLPQSASNTCNII